MKTPLTSDPAPARRPRGRPRAFDRDRALERAMQVFWEKGYEAASLADLTRAMDINPPSLYAAFGDKEGLFVEAIERYHESVKEACPFCDTGSARDAIEKLLNDVATLFTDRSHPPGCMSVVAMMTSPTGSPRLQKLLAEHRAQGKHGIRERILRGVREGDLAPDTDVAALTDFYIAVVSGMSLHAREGASRKALLATVQAAMRAWPEPPAKRATRAKVRAAA